LRLQALKEKGWKSKTAGDWDKKAQSFARRNKESEYTTLFLSHLPLKPEHTVLDVGSGPGTLSLPIARKVCAVTALDFSRGMLDALESIACQEGIANVTTRQCAWEDNWQAMGIKQHNIAIASRSMGVKDLSAAVEKLDTFATDYVFISDRIGSTPFDSEAFEAIGRPFQPGPDYIYTLNILYTMGIHPNITVLRLAQETTYRDMAEAMEGYSWMFKELTSGENLALEEYLTRRTIFASASGITIRRSSPPEWALIWWQKQQPTDTGHTSADTCQPR